jgi:hypothetical protein
MKKLSFVCTGAIVLMLASPAVAQVGAGAGRGAGGGTGGGTGASGDQSTSSSASAQAAAKAGTALTMATSDAAQAQLQRGRFVTTLTNVQIELTLSDQIGSATPEKKTVSMIVSSGNWGKIRSFGTVRPPADAPVAVDLNVDARPFVSVDGPIQLELTLSYAPPVAPADSREGPRPRPSGLNQSMTVILQSGKALVVSQAADPISDRKVVVEVKATILK